MANEKKTDLDDKMTPQIKLSNASDVIKHLADRRLNPQRDETFYTLVQGNTYSDVDVKEENLKENSVFIADCWD